MNPEDRQAFDSLLRRHSQLVESLAQFKFDLKTLEQQVELRSAIPEISAPPLPPTIPQNPPPPLPPIPLLAEVVAPVPEYFETEKESVPSFPTETITPPLPEISPALSTEERQRNLESQFGRWLARIGVVLLLLTVIYASTVAYEHFHEYIGPWAKLTFLSLISIGLTILGLKMERWDAKLTVYARTLAGGGLACLYYTLYGATYVAPLQVIHSHILGGLLLLGWSAYVLYLAEQKKSELLSVFAIALAYFSSAITPVGDFTMIANLILSLTAVIFLIRNAWTGLSYLCLVGTYLGSLRQLIDYPSADFGFEFAHHVEFWPTATYLAGAWIIYTTGIFLATTPHFASGKRMAFLCLNNGALLGLLLAAASLSGFDHFGGILCWIGGIFLAACCLAKQLRPDMSEVASSYLAQGLGLFTGGLAIVYTGVTRGLVITIESVFLAAAGAYSRSWIFKIAGYAAALLGTTCLMDEMVLRIYSTVLPVTGVLAMLANAWFARREWWDKPRDEANATFVFSSAYHVFLALSLAGVGLFSAQLSDESITIGLAVTALAMTMAVYIVPIFELAPMSQLLLVAAQATAFIPFSDTTHQSAWCQNLVGAITMILTTWWPRQKQVRTGIWTHGLLMIYALAMIGYVFNNLHPQLTDQQWMMTASALSLVFVAYGAWARLWSFIVAGQILLVLSVAMFLTPPVGNGPFPWTWWAAAVPVLTVYLTSWLAGYGLPRVMKLSENVAEQLRITGHIYRAIGLGLLVRWIFGVVPAEETTLAFFALATALLIWNCRWSNAFSARSALVIDLVGIGSHLYAQENLMPSGFTWSDSIGVVLFLLQPAILRHWGRNLITHAESWAVVVLSTLLGWFFVSHSIDLFDEHNLTLGWALYALSLTVLGFAANERRQRWCGLAILVASIIRVGVYDFWGFSDLYKVLTFFVLTVICLGLSFLYYKFADRLKEWL